MNNWTVIITFIYPHEAHIAKGVLEAAGFEVIIKDELTAQVNNFYSTAIGGVKLMVPEDNAEQAYATLKEAGFIKKEEEKKDKIDSFSKEYAKTCPYCHSDEVMKKKMPGYVLIFSILLLGLPIPFIRKTYYCFDCGKEWQVKP